ncbi:MAG: M23 family metallopeptidase [Candidatus Nanoarchaeia archaeon]|nr:M23 family metallopeptidase [Candidatus Nanoarchaeia archaeon]MDD5588266.1 M23 family metallopeptidase [Candidatus Nanoarchaeia archaeon]
MISKNIYGFPCKLQDTIKIMSDPRAHFGDFKYAIDFILSEKSQVLAAFDGKVVDLKMDSNEGGIDPKYNDVKYINYITIKHTNDEYSQYAHLKYKSNFVKIGDQVKEGQTIALSGNTGFSSTPHLHFQVFKTNLTGYKTLQIKFKDILEIDTSKQPIPKKYDEYIKELKKVEKRVS